MIGLGAIFRFLNPNPIIGLAEELSGCENITIAKTVGRLWIVVLVRIGAARFGFVPVAAFGTVVLPD